MKRRSPFLMARYGLEYVGLRLGLALADRLPLPLLNRVACSFADLAFLTLPARMRTACDNIRRAGIASSETEIRRIALASFRHFAALAVESLVYDRTGSDLSCERNIRLEISPGALELLRAPGQGVILVSGHFGNWEIAARILSTFKPVTGVTRVMDNPLTEALIRRRKTTERFHLSPKHDANSLRLVNVLRRGEVLALLADQHAWDRPMIVDFLGRPAATHTSVALLHLITRAPLCLGWCLRTGPMAYTLEVLPPFSKPPSGNRDNDIRAILDWIHRRLETAIRSHPEQYLWAHQRWRAPSRPRHASHE